MCRYTFICKTCRKVHISGSGLALSVRKDHLLGTHTCSHSKLKGTLTCTHACVTGVVLRFQLKCLSATMMSLNHMCVCVCVCVCVCGLNVQSVKYWVASLLCFLDPGASNPTTAILDMLCVLLCSAYGPLWSRIVVVQWRGCFLYHSHLLVSI